MELTVITPQGTTHIADIEKAYLPGVLGPFTVLRNHGPILSVLTQGQVKYEKEGILFAIDVPGGVVEVLSNKIVVITN
ncbi:MAG: hypothetical protein LUD74_08345 [Tannerellaceae bacterium]|nr:hypothetical protein [Tannerellaceae bacterium]